MRSGSIAVLALALGAGCVAADVPLLVLASRTRVRFEAGGVTTRLEAETHALGQEAAPVPVPEEAGPWLAYAARPAGAYVPAPGGLAQRSAGPASFDLTAWRPEPASRELRLALPPAPGAELAVESDRELPFELVGAGRLVRGGDGVWRAPLPPDGLAWLRWGGSPARAGRDYLETSRLEVGLELDRITFRAQLRGHTTRRSLPVLIPPGVVLDEAPGSRPAAGEPGNGIFVAPAEPGWFELVLAGRIEPRGDRLRLAPLEIKDLPRATAAQVVVAPRSARRLQPADPKPGDWALSELAGGVKRYVLRPTDEPVPPLEFVLRGRADAEPPPAGVDRITVRTQPSGRAPDRIESQVTYRVGRKGTLRLQVPEGVELSRFQLDGARFGLTEFRDSANGTRFATGEVLLPGVLSMTVQHPALPAELAGSLVELAVPRPTQEPSEIEWTGRLPDGYLCLGAGTGDPELVWGLPYPVRWMVGLLDGLVTVGREAGIPVAFALAGLLALYAYLFLPPPGRQSAYTLSVLLASAATLVGLVHAARAPPRTSRPASEADSSDPGGLFSFPAMGDALRRMSPLALPGAGSGATAGPDDPQARPRDLGAGPAPGGPPSLPGLEGLEAGGDLRGGGGPRRGGEAETRPEAIPDQWDLARVAAPDPTLPGQVPAEPRIKLRILPTRLPLAAAILLALAMLAAVGLAARAPEPRAQAAVLVLGAILLPLDMLVPDPLFPASFSLLAALLTAAGYRGGRQLVLFWERVRHEIERRRVAGARGRGRDPEDDGDEPAARGQLRKNEMTYEQVFRDEDGIEFIPEPGPGASPS